MSSLYALDSGKEMDENGEEEDDRQITYKIGKAFSEAHHTMHRWS